MVQTRLDQLRPDWKCFDQFSSLCQFRPLWASFHQFKLTRTSLNEFNQHCLAKLAMLIPVSTTLDQFAPVRTNLDQFKLVWTSLHQCVPVMTSIGQFRPIQTRLNQVRPVQKSLQEFEPVMTNFDQFGLVSVSPLLTIFCSFESIHTIFFSDNFYAIQCHSLFSNSF